MAGHLRQHSFTGNTDHNFTGLSNNYLPKLNSSGTGITDSQIYDNGTNIGVGISNPLDKIHINNGTLRINDTGSTYGAGKIAISDANGSISFSSITSLNLGSVNKYATSLTTPGAGVTNTITHNLGTTDITVILWLESTGDMTNAKVTNRLSNSVDIIFTSAPGENVRVVVIG